MVITKFSIENYKKFRQLELSFAPGINVIVGDNEAGKSTLAQAFLDVLYKDPSTKSKGYLDKVKPWQTDQLPKLKLNFQALDSNFILEKDFRTGSLLFENINSHKQISTYKESLAALKKIIGVASEEIYERTAFISQGDVALRGSSENLLHEITDAGNPQGAGNSKAQLAVKKLQTDLNNLRRGMDRPTNVPGPLKQQKNNIVVLEKSLAEKKQIWEKRQTASSKHKDSGGKLEQVTAKIEELEELLKNHKLGKELKSELKELTAQTATLEEKLRDAANLEIEIQKLQEEVKKYTAFNHKSLEADAAHLVENEQTSKVLNSELKNLTKTIAINTQAVATVDVESRKKYPILAIVVLIVAFGLSGLIYLANESLLVPGIVLLIGLLVSGGLFLWKKISAETEKKAEKERKDDSLQKLEQELTTKLAGAEENLNRLLQKYGVQSSQDFYSLKAAHSTVNTKLADADSKLQIILGGEKLDIVKKRQVELLLKKKELETTKYTDQVRNSELTPEAYLQKSRELDKLYIEKKKLEESVIESKTRVADSDVQYADLVKLEEQLILAKTELKELEQKETVLRVAAETMQEAILGVAKSANELLREAVEAKLPALTNDRYSKIKVNNDLSIEVYSKEKSDWVDPIAELSRGTIDQIYFLTRLGFLQLITEGKAIPLILDDPFVTADVVRKDNFRKLLTEISKQYQILLFTNDSEYLDWGNAVSL